MSQVRQRLAMSKPTQGAAGKTGTWRVFKPVVDKERCNQCGLCEMYCPDAAIDEDLNVDLAFCKGVRYMRKRMPEKSH
jgi:pyruvate ferredoxin oxidoreductase delta subunit